MIFLMLSMLTDHVHFAGAGSNFMSDELKSSAMMDGRREINPGAWRRSSLPLHSATVHTRRRCAHTQPGGPCVCACVCVCVCVCEGRQRNEWPSCDLQDLFSPSLSAICMKMSLPTELGSRTEVTQFPHYK